MEEQLYVKRFAARLRIIADQGFGGKCIDIPNLYRTNSEAYEAAERYAKKNKEYYEAIDVWSEYIPVDGYQR